MNYKIISCYTNYRTQKKTYFGFFVTTAAKIMMRTKEI